MENWRESDVLLKTLHVLSILCVGSFAGLLWAFEIGVLPMLGKLGASDYTLVEQLLIRFLDSHPLGVITVATAGMILPIFTLVLRWKDRGSAFWKLTFAAWALFFGVGLFTIILNVPVNNYVLEWDVENPPADWEDARNDWSLYNQIRTPVNYLSFLLFILAAFRIPNKT